MATKKTGKKVSIDEQCQLSDDVVDAVFVIGTGSENNNEELRYALRNVEKHCPFIRNVYISGECPEWVDKTKVIHLKWPDRFKHAKDANIIDKLRHACEQPGIAKKILFCSDDQFQTRVCSWDDFAPRWLRRYDKNDGWYESRNRLWHTRLHKTLDRDRRRRDASGLNSKDVFYYQPHIWMQIDRDLFIEYAKWSDYEHRDDTIIASGYFNFIDAGGESNYDHIFISERQSWPVKETHVAYTDGSFKAAMEYLKEEFSERSKYELQQEEIKQVDKSVVKKDKADSPNEPHVIYPPGVIETVNKCKEQFNLAAKEINRQNKLAFADNEKRIIKYKAAEHLSVAIAYLNSNSRRPTKLETMLAVGEIRVAAQHLLELNYGEEYRMCIETIENARISENSLTPDVFKSVLTKIIK